MFKRHSLSKQNETERVITGGFIRFELVCLGNYYRYFLVILHGLSLEGDLLTTNRVQCEPGNDLLDMRTIRVVQLLFFKHFDQETSLISETPPFYSPIPKTDLRLLERCQEILQNVEVEGWREHSPAVKPFLVSADQQAVSKEQMKEFVREAFLDVLRIRDDSLF